MKVLYLEGDECSPKYVAGALEAGGAEVERVVARPARVTAADFDTCFLSDYDAATLGAENVGALVDRVRHGAGLVVVGGWRSFGAGGFAATLLAEILPVTMRHGDDRVNVPSGLLLEPDEPGHDLLAGLPFDPPPVIAGYNDTRPRAGARVVLSARRITRVRADRAELDATRIPIVVLGEGEDGRIAAVLTDLAPHWSGGWTDWGDARVALEHGEEAGSSYVEFLARLARWSAGQDPALPEGGRRAERRAT